VSRDIYAALSGAFGAWRQMETIANNLANANTAGFKAERIAYEATGPEGAYARIAEGWLDPADGAPRPTGEATHVALQGPGWLVVEADGASLLTRDGQLHVDPDDGLLRTMSGHAVLGDGGPIVVPPGATVRIAEDGEVATTEGEILGRLTVVEAEAEPLGGNLWRPLSVPVARTARLVPGAVEQSNVDPVHAMIQLVEASRAFEQFQKVLQASDELDARLNEITRGGG
jgi:flagellar basal-body rod protein FlgF